MLEEPRIQLLGPVQLFAGDRTAPIGGPGVRGLLALLALSPNRIIALDELIDVLWNHDPPPTARTIVHGNVSQLRRILRSFDPARIRIDTAAPGYRLVVDPARVDAHHARALFERARTAPPAERADLLARACSLWQGPELGGVPETVRAPELADLRIAVHGARVDADLALGRHADLIAELTRIVHEDPRRERTTGQLMRALYYSGRRADALEVYRSAARFASDRLGLDPGPELRALHERVLNDDLAPAAVPVDVTRVVPRQLPPAVPSLSGRSADLAWLESLGAGAAGAGTDAGAGAARVAAGAAVAVITGPPGIGKSALAVSWAHGAVERFPDGALFATLRGFDSPVPVAEVLAQFLLGLGVAPADLPESERERLALYRSLIGGRRILVVLDDARSAEQVRPLLPPGPGSVTVVTSRARLDGLAVSHGARVRRLEPLARPDSVRLIADVAGRGAAEHHEQLARLCGDLPLALRIAGARLAAGPAWTVTEFVAELEGERTRLAALDVDDAGVRAALDVSYRGLPSDVASMFRVLGAFPGPTVGPFVAAALCGVPVAEARRRLRVLAAHNLLAESGPEVFTRHDLVRLYQRELAGGLPVPGRAMTYYQAAADQARRRLLRIVDPVDFSGAPVELPPPGGFDEALAWFAAEWLNLLAVVEAAHESGHWDDVWRLARVAHTYRVVRPLWDEWRRLVSLGMAAAEASGDPEARFWMLISRCAMSLTFDLGGESLADASAAVAVAADSRREVIAKIHLGCALDCCGRHEEAISCLVEAVEAASMTGEDELRGQALANCAEALKAAGRYAEAISHQLESLKIDKRLGDESYVVVSLNNLAESYFSLGDDATAADYASEAVELASRRGFLLQEAVGRASLGRIMRRRGDDEGARLQLGLAVDLHRRVSPRPAPEVVAELAALGVESPDEPGSPGA
ncbi:BTAD domain-containing putative transcriptional regulator [Amycolatopsis endophytica]|uniref:DNA-binding SARP family transcriptional activator n=1 Tax=Amycolatopsis endophytica TaxID=860233 RepID=A0A853B2U7_9PSEU|nr:AfsR/SARP family transcriptional regulator [Amycolatopsis endophytica]NYI89137.1 DNA-binding SARP family transcriptional activator [Amycolatopsis endophytica]